ncbi:uncharacterized protein [Atheta coriaria]|uniref:uncharacterized protein isoform X2 n=1 Tax=Dalotia coriaria TaxID=877792 RepID=UPI0031F34803
MEAIKYDPGYQETLLSTLKLHLAANKVILHRKQYFQPAERVIRRQTIYFRYQINDEIDIEVKKTPFIMKTINPNSAYYLVYEIIRCCLVIFQFFILSLQMNLLYEYRHNIQKLHITCDVLSWIDIFIRLRLHYYRSDGILVTDFKSVAKHYITHAFAVDFYASCPFSTLSVDAMINISKPVVVKHFLLCLSRPLQLYRVFLGISYLCPRIKVTSEVTIVRIQCILFMMVVIPIGANLLVLSACVIDSDSLRCPMNGWGGGDITEITPMTSLVHYAYLASLYLHGCPFNGYAEKSNFSYTIYLFITLISLSLAWFMMSKLINLGLHGQFMTLRLQNDRTHFQKFAKLEGVNSKLTKRLLEVNSLLTKKSSRTALQEASKRLPPQLFSDLTYGFNELSFKNNKLFFDAAHSIQRHLASHFKRIFFIKDDIIIRNNDINQYIFIVVRGSVKVSVAGCKIAVMQVGGMFGCLSDKKRIRQLIDVTAATHTECIYVKSTVLNRYLYNYKTVKRRISSYVKQNMEYVEACAATANDDSSTIQVLPPTHTTRYTRFFKKLQQSLHRSRGGFRTYYYLLNVHLSAFSTMFILILQMVAMHEDLSYHFYIILYLLDAMFIVKILLSFTLPFVDATSGIVVVKMKTIIFSSEFHVALLTSNRILRIILFARYYNRSRVSNNLTHSLRRIFIAYITLIYLQFTTNVWFYVACSLHVGRYRKFVSHAPEEYIPILTLYHTYLFSYVHVLNVFTGNGVKAIKPLNIEEIIVTIIITISSVFMMSAIASRCALVQIIDNYSLNYYRNKIDEVKTHLTNLRLSPYILHKLVRYYEFIWRIQRGNQFPMLINETGRYLREDIRIDLYSELILQNAIFKNAHKDFIRQMLVNLKRFAYPRSMVIVHQHEVNGSMYFIQSGNVAIVDVSTNGDMKKVGFLKAGQSFGEVQGLTIAPFQFTYVAETLVIVMSLRKKSWAYLLEFFPATMNNIQQNLSEHFGVTDKI